eukprot:CAMPEP_0179902648 /NCGR_PEP_ID=MMETSP0982-20121206/40687_2 /TAXON_ID=483367 /ORGANISM="non described non described, Strain CCMP 2436" /LENGTH=70 /DNA_ID=CAMNT_0021801831 /DNA_START=316 /DNA_END=528 /DNA_ORIENTATION=-
MKRKHSVCGDDNARMAYVGDEQVVWHRWHGVVARRRAEIDREGRTVRRAELEQVTGTHGVARTTWASACT